MAQRGFEYEPRSFNVEEVFGREVGAGLSRTEFAERYGYGFAPFMAEQIANQEQELMERSATTEDPNQTYINTLSEGERAQWHLALDGDSADNWADLFGAGTQDTNGKPESCRDVASAALDESDALVVKAQEGLFAVYLEKVPNDDRMVQAERDWLACVRNKGYSPDSREDWNSEFETKAFIAAGSDITSEVPPALTEQATREIYTAIELLPCDTRFEETWKSVREEYEAEFLTSSPSDL